MRQFRFESFEIVQSGYFGCSFRMENRNEFMSAHFYLCWIVSESHPIKKTDRLNVVSLEGFLNIFQNILVMIIGTLVPCCSGLWFRLGFRHVFPIAVGHILGLQPWIGSLSNGNGLKILPE